MILDYVVTLQSKQTIDICLLFLQSFENKKKKKPIIHLQGINPLSLMLNFFY